MNFEEIFDSDQEVLNELFKRLYTLEHQLTKVTGEVKTYQFLITRILVEQRAMTDRISELEKLNGISSEV